VKNIALLKDSDEDGIFWGVAEKGIVGKHVLLILHKKERERKSFYVRWVWLEDI
jgi:hypothetical protein